MLGYCISLSAILLDTGPPSWIVEVWNQGFVPFGCKGMHLAAMLSFSVGQIWQDGGILRMLAAVRNHWLPLPSILQSLDYILICRGGLALLGRFQLWVGSACLHVVLGVSILQSIGHRFAISPLFLFQSFLDGPLLQMTELGDVLHRQIMLSTVRLFRNLFLGSGMPDDYLTVGHGDATLRCYCPKQRGGYTSLCGLVPTELLIWQALCYRPEHTMAVGAGQLNAQLDVSWMSFGDFLGEFSILMDFYWQRSLLTVYAWSLSLLSWGGMATAAFFRTLCLVCLIYQCRLVAFAIGLRGGSCNLDAWILCLRSFCRGAGWHWGLPLANFSPRQADACQNSRRNKRRSVKFGYSSDLFLMLLILFALFGRVNAGSGRSDGLDPTGFRARKRARHRCGSLVHLRHVARNLDSPTSTSSDPEDQYMWYFFRIFGVGMWSEVMVREFRIGTSIRDVLDVLEADSRIGQISSPGHLAPVRGLPLDDFAAAVWVPTWSQYVPGATLLIDPSLIGREPFSLWYPYRHITLDHLQELLVDIWEFDVFAFSLYHSQQPITEASMYLARDGTTICLQRDAMAQFAFENEFLAFHSYSMWGRDMLEQDDPLDLPWGISHVQLTCDGDTFPVSVGLEELTWHTLHTIALRFIEGEGEPRLQLAREVPERCTMSGVPVLHLAFCSATTPPPEETVIFLDLRGIGWDGCAAVLPRGAYNVAELLATLELDIPFVPGFRVQISGGHRRGRRWTFQSGDVVRFRYTSDEFSATEESSESECLHSDECDDNCDSTTSGHSQPYRAEFGAAEHELASGSGGPVSSFTDGSIGSGCAKLDALAAHSGSADMWNGAEYLDVLLRDKHWDTPTAVPSPMTSLPSDGDPSLRPTVRYGKMRLSPKRVLHVHGLRWGLLGLVLYSQCVNAVGVAPGDSCTAVLLPVCGGHDTPSSETSCSPAPFLHDWDDCNCTTGPLAPATSHDDPEVLHLSVGNILTALEDGKTDAFWRTCAELGWFLNCLFDRVPDGKNDSNSIALGTETLCGQRSCASRTPLRIFEALQLQESAACHDPRGLYSIGLPEGWQLPGNLLRTWDDFALHIDLSGWHLHEASIAALHWSGLLDYDQCQGWDLHIYTDGSAKADQAGWAVVIVASNPHSGRCSFLGCFGGRLGADDDLGSSAADALQAEQVALCWACLWTLPQIPFLQATFNRVIFCWDCLAAGLGASGDCCLADTPVARPLRGLFSVIFLVCVSRPTRAIPGMSWPTQLLTTSAVLIPL